MNLRKKTLLIIFVVLGLILGVMIGSLLLSNDLLKTNFQYKNLAPSTSRLFGTDWLGRDMLTRTIKGLSMSILVGLIASIFSVFISLFIGILGASMGKKMDAFISWLIDVFLGIPHLLAILLISFALGKGLKGVIIGVAVTHWPSLARVIRAEVLQIKSAEFIKVAENFGKSKWWIATKHVLPHLLPQLFVGLILIFPHAILHEASITFLGFGLSPQQPAIGIILSESMKYLSTGMWWLAFFPGLSLLIITRCFDILGTNIRKLLDPHSAHE